MSSCPGEEQLASLLDERLGVDDLAIVEQHLESCPHCQQALEELTYERFSAAEWNTSADRPDVADAQDLKEDQPRQDRAGLPLLDCASQAEQDAHRKRLILELFPRQPSSLHIPQSEKQTASGEPSATVPPQVDGYDIVGRLGRGGMGVVYRARQRGLDRLVALKMLRGGGHADSESLARFRIEVRAVARLRHPNVVQVFDVGESQGLPFVSLELLEGGSLEAKTGGNPQPEIESASLVATLARAIASAHRAGIVHRDLKPANVLFSRDGIPKVTDFGLAKRLDEDDGQTQSGQVMGSPSFMAPEQAQGDAKGVGPAADIYSLGAILYEILTGRPPFKGGSPIETLHQVVHIDPVTPSKLRPGLSRDLETICLKCLSKESTQRYLTADELADDLDRFLAGSPIEARRIRFVERGWKWSKREPAAATLALASGLAVIASIMVGVWSVQTSRDRVARLRNEGSRSLIFATTSEHDHHWAEGRERLKTFLRDAATEPVLSDLSQQAETLLRQLETGEATEKHFAGVQKNLDLFRQATRLAQLSDAHGMLASRDLGGDPRPIRQAAQNGLALLGTFDLASNGEAEAWRKAEHLVWQSDSERAEVDSSCLELVLLWVEATGKAAPGEDPTIQHRKALEMLDRVFRDQRPTRASLFLRSRLSSGLGDHASAERDRNRAEQIEATSALDRVASGRDRQLRGDWSGAITEYEAALGSDSNQFRTQLDLAICELQAGRPEAARAGFTACLQRESKLADLFLLRGVASGEAAKHCLDQAKIRRDPIEQANAERLFQAAEADFKMAEDRLASRRDRFTLLLDRGIVHVRANRLLDAAADFTKAVELEPNHLAALVNSGQVLHRLGRNDEAIAQFTRAIAIEPTRPELFRVRAIARLDRQSSLDPSDADRALSDLNEAIRLGRPGSPDLAGDLARRARLQHRAGHYEASLADCDESLRIMPDQADAPLVRVQTLLELKRYAAVVQACDAALDRRPNTVDYWELRGVAQSHQEDFAGAVGDFTRALALDPDRLSARIQRGWAYLVSDASKLALVDFEVVIARNPDNAEGYGGRGFALAMAGQHRLATADAEESLRKARVGDARAVYNAARIYARAATVLAKTPIAKRPSNSLVLAEEYQERCLSLIRAAIDRLPSERRQTFYRDVVQSDPALAGIRQRPQFARLAGHLGRPTQ